MSFSFKKEIEITGTSIATAIENALLQFDTKAFDSFGVEIVRNENDNRKIDLEHCIRSVAVEEMADGVYFVNEDFEIQKNFMDSSTNVVVKSGNRCWLVERRGEENPVYKQHSEQILIGERKYARNSDSFFKWG